jgi:ChpA-C
MKSWAKWTVNTVLVTTGFAAAGGGLSGVALASAGGGNNGPDTGNISVLGGNHVQIPVSVPVDLCGNAAALLGFALAGCQDGASVLGGPAAGFVAGGGGLRAGNIGVAGGDRITVPVKIGIDACGNSVGNAVAHCHGGVTLPAGTGAGVDAPGGVQAGNIGVGSGNDIDLPIGVPVSACGNAVAILGDSSAGCVGGATVGGPGAGYPAAPAPKAESKSGDANPLVGSELAGLGTLPGVANLPTLAGLGGLPLVGGLLTGTPLSSLIGSAGALLPASTLSAAEQSTDGSGLTGNSMAAIAIGALMAGAAALKLAGRRSRGRSRRAGVQDTGQEAAA